MMPYWMFRSLRFWKIVFVVWVSSCASACAADTFSSNDAGDDGPIVVDGGDGASPSPDAALDGGSDDSSDGSHEADADGGVTVVKTQRIMFVTQARFSANLGGTTGADALCTATALDAGIGTAGGPFAAWLSTKLSDVQSRFVHGTVPYKLVNGTTIASDWTELSSGTLKSLYDVDEHGAIVTYDGGNYPVGLPWSNTDIDGTLKSGWPGTFCLEMTSTVSADNSVCGADYLTNQNWTASVSCGCGETHSLYCVEQ